MNIYPASVIIAIRQRLGLQPEDNSKDVEIMDMSKEKALNCYLEWEGVHGYTRNILSITEFDKQERVNTRFEIFKRSKIFLGSHSDTYLFTCETKEQADTLVEQIKDHSIIQVNQSYVIKEVEVEP